MKRIILFTFMVFLFNTNIYGQNPNQPFVGLWEWRNGEEVFRVSLRIENERIRGDFYMVQINSSGLVINTIYKSDKDIGLGLKWGHVIYANSNGYLLGGSIADNTTANTPALFGELKMELIQNGSLGLSQATWKVKRGQGIRVSTDNRVFNIPTDIVLTKVQ